MSRRKPRGRPLDGWLIIDKPPGLPAPMWSTASARLRRAESRPWRHAGPAGHRRAADRLRRRDQDRALCDGRHQALPLHPALRRGARHRRCRRPGHRDLDGRGRPTRRSRPRCPRFRGDIMQVPPIFSAIKVAGERAYDMAREGRAPVLEPRPARVDRFELDQRPDADTAVFEVASRQGRLHAQPRPRPGAGLRHGRPYRRAAPHARRAVHRGRRRFRWTNSRAADDTAPASPDLLLPVATALADIPALALTEAEAAASGMARRSAWSTLMGRIPGSADPDGGLVRAMAGGRVIGLCRLEDGWLKPERML